MRLGVIFVATIDIIMAKSKPIGVRFDDVLLDKLKSAGIANSPQKALNLYERSYLELQELLVKVNNKPAHKKTIEDLRNLVAPLDKTIFVNPVKVEDCFFEGDDDIRKEIDMIIAEKIPKDRDTSMGRKTWNHDQASRIRKLESLLNEK